MFGVNKHIGNEAGNTPSIIKDPFEKGLIKGVHLHALESSFNQGQFSYSGSVEFRNGQTEGKQNFAATSMDDLYTQVANFIKTLK